MGSLCLQPPLLLSISAHQQGEYLSQPWFDPYLRAPRERARNLLLKSFPAITLSCPQKRKKANFRVQPTGPRPPYLGLLFSRPHTVIGTVKYAFMLFHALSIVSVSLLAVEGLSDISPLFLTGSLEAVVSALFMNIYIVGLNQLSDIDIDKVVNKPTLPLASGEYSPATGVAIVTTFAVLSFAVGFVVGSQPLLLALFISFVLGTAYSIDLPYFRWKRSAVVAALCIVAVRAVIVQLAFFLHIQASLLMICLRPMAISKPLIFATTFMTFFSVVIALFKDIPDIDGDRIFGIKSFSVRLGQKKVFWICVGLLQMAYGVAMLMGAASSCLWSKYATVVSHAVLAAILWKCAQSVDLTSKSAITSFYMFIWKLFYAEYLIIPLVR
ncbi:putative homogentisate phytyltransferase 1, chloroplastic [Hordeum vulgare]|nr:putative homogentisate phytyltransferase 1, chloroplastic [Hordeum vulgare]